MQEFDGILREINQAQFDDVLTEQNAVLSQLRKQGFSRFQNSHNPESEVTPELREGSGAIQIPGTGDVLEALKPKVVCVGDVFKVRGCTFEVTEINESGIVAKGIKYSEWLSKKGRTR